MAKTEPAAAAALAGTWHSEEIDADIVLQDQGGKLQLDTSRMVLPVAPCQPLDPETWISDTGMQIEVQRDAGGAPVGLRMSTGRARGIVFTRR